MHVLREGQHTLHVFYMQGLLNKAMQTDGVRNAVPLKTDYRFGPRTKAAVVDFQRRRRLSPDGVCGPITWAALGHVIKHEHVHIQKRGQPTDMSCWSAAATIILGNQSVGPGFAQLFKDGSLKPTIENLQKYADGLGWSMLNMTPTVAVLRDIVRRRPVWIAARHSTGGHVVVLSGVYGDANGEADRTCFRVHDPWPPNVGSVYCTFSNPIMFCNQAGQPVDQASLEFVLVPP